MGMKVVHVIQLTVGLDDSLKDKVFELDETLATVSLTGFDKVVSGNFSVAASGNEDLPLGDVDTPKGLYLEVSAAVSVTLNGGAEAIALVPGSTDGKAKMFLEATLSQINIANAGSSPVTGRYCIWGLGT